ncbi:MAG: hypothetical protein ACYTBJ_08970 [Planctomycetota bacterium]|jgi:hypothetical protein
MAHKTIVLCAVILLAAFPGFLAAGDKARSDLPELPPMETFFLQPIDVETVSYWVPAAKAGPLINRACRGRDDSFSSVLPAGVQHTKKQGCPEDLARLLAEHTARYHERSMPLTIFNGWQWEYAYSLCQYESVEFRLPSHGGSWESTWETILTQSEGSIGLEWLQVPTTAAGSPCSSAITEPQSSIEVKTFSSMRVRDGYPKERQLQ